MDKEQNKRIREQLTSAESIIRYFDSNPSLSNTEWLEVDDVLTKWFDDPDVPEKEKWEVRFSGYTEMLYMICSGIRNRLNRD